MRVAIVGAGASGLPAIKTCLEEGLEPVCFERSDDIGGLWKYKEGVEEGQASVYKSTVINTSKEMMCYSDFPIPSDYPIFMPNKYVQKYYNLYADNFNLKEYIKFNTEILHIKRNKDFSRTGQWDVQVLDKNTGITKTVIFDAVMLATGHHADVHKPTFPGIERFTGEVIHTHDYKHPRGFDDKRVVIIGIGNSGGDLAVEMSRIASQVYLSTRRGSWIIHRVSNQGMPVDMIYNTRFWKRFKETFPKIYNYNAAKKLNSYFDHALYALKPNHPVFAAHVMINDDLPNRIAAGLVKIKPDIELITETGVKFDNGTYEDNIDTIFLATGYKFGFPFLEKSVIDVKNNEVELYKYMFPLTTEKSTLAVIGCFQPYGAVMPISELQCRLAARVFKGTTKLPSKAEMKKDIDLKRSEMARDYVQSQRHTIQVDYIGLSSEIAKMIGCQPRLGKMMLTDPRLARNVMFGPCTPYQYRLSGPHAWRGARRAILSQWDRTLVALKTRPLQPKKHVGQLGLAVFLVSTLPCMEKIPCCSKVKEWVNWDTK